MKHERDALRRRERLEHDQQCQPDRIREQRLVLGVGAGGRVDDWIGDVHVERLLAPRSA